MKSGRLITPEELDAVRAVLKAAGKEGTAVHRGELAVYARVPERIAREAVRRLVMEGEPVVSLNDGYRYTDDRDTLDAEIRSLKHRAAEILARANALERHVSPQLALFAGAAR